MSGSPRFRTDSEGSSGLNREEPGSLAEWERSSDATPTEDSFELDVEPVPLPPDPAGPPRAPDDYPGPTRLELSCLSEWAIETEATLARDIPIIHPAGPSRKTATPVRRGKGLTEDFELREPSTKTRRRPRDHRPPTDNVQHELDEIQAALQKTAERASRSNPRS